MAEEKQEFKQLVRIGGADIPGNKKVFHALRKIKGVSYSFSNAICKVSSINPDSEIGSLKDEELKKVNDIMNNPLKYEIPSFMMNRRRDSEDGIDKHLISTDIRFRKDFDIKRLKKIKAYRGMRHAAGLPVRGQRTKGHFRKGRTVGVRKKAGMKKGKV